MTRFAPILLLAALAVLAWIQLSGPSSTDDADEPRPPSARSGGAGSEAPQPSVKGRGPEGIPSDAYDPRVEIGAGQRALRGKVVTAADDDPLNDVTVQVRLFRGADCDPAQLEDETEVVTDSEGSFAWPLPRGVATMSAQVSAQAPGFVCQSQRVVIRADAPLAPFEFSLSPFGDAVRLTVRDPSGRPIEGASIEATGLFRPRKTGADGSAQLPVMRGARQIIARVSRSEFATRRLRIDLATGPTEIVLEPGCDLEGRIVSIDGLPVHRARITVADQSVPTVSSDQQGRFRLAGLKPAPGTARLRVRHPGFVHTVERVVLQSGVVSVDVRLSRGRSVFGRIVDVQGRGMAGASVRLVELAVRDHPVAVVSGMRGAFRFEGRGAGPAYLEVTHPGNATALVRLPSGEDSDEAPLVIRLEGGASLEGVLRDDRGLAVQGARVVARAPAFGRLSLSTRTTATGTFRLEDLPRGPLRLEITRYGYLPLKSRKLIPGGAPLELNLQRGVHLKGRVLDATGREPVTDFRVRIVATRLPSVPLPRQWSDSGRRFLSPDGHFHSNNALLQPGETYRIEVTSPGYEVSVLPRLSVPAEGSLASVPIMLRRGATLRGRVLDERGEPVAGARIRTLGRRAPQVETDLGGRFELIGLAAGRSVLIATSVGQGQCTSGPHQLSPGQDLDLGDLRLASAGTLEVEVIGASGEALPDVTVSCLSPQAPGAAARDGTSDPGGRVIFHGLPTGPVLVTARIDGREVKAEHRIARGSYAAVRLAAGGGTATLEGRVALPEGLDRAVVLTLEELDPLRAESAPRIRIAGADGSFAFQHLATGAYRLTGSVRYGETRLEGGLDLEIGPGREAITLRLQAR